MNVYQLYLINAKKSPVSPHFTLADISYSDTALANGIDNRPSVAVLANAKLLITKVLEPIRNHFNKPITVNCIYRCPVLNAKVGGVSNSQHVLGQAVDFTIAGVPDSVIIDYIRHNLIFDQCIEEQTTDAKWVHVSYTPKNRKEVLAYINGKYIAS